MVNEALKDALKQAIIELQSGAGAEAPVEIPGLSAQPNAAMEMKKEDPLTSDKAPSIKGAGMPEGESLQMEALMGLADRSHGGRGPMSLGEKVADGAKAKMAALKDKKK